MKRLAPLAAAAFVLSAVVAAPAAAGERTTIVGVDSSRHPEVALTVEPPDALAEADLPAEAFEVRENGSLVPVTVHRATDATEDAARERLDVVLVLDTSGSMQGAPIAAAKAAAGAFVAQLPAGSRLGLVAFGDTPTVATQLTDDRDAVRASIDGLQARGETALYDAVILGLAQFDAADGSRRALVVLSDGGDTASAESIEAATAALAGAAVEFAAVELVTAEYDGTGLRVLANAGAGAVFSADDPRQLADVYGDVAAGLLNRYIVTYPSGAGGETEIALTVRWGAVSSTTDRNVLLPDAAAVAVAAPEADVVDGPGWLASPAALAAGAGVLFVLFAILLSWTFLRPRDRRVSLTERFGSTGQRLRLPAISDWADRASRAAERRLVRSGRDSSLYSALERAGLALRPGEFVVLAGVGSVVALMLGAAVGGLLVGLGLGALSLAAGPVTLRVLAHRRRSAFAEQLADTIQLVTGNLRAGHSVLQAIDSVAADAPSPTKEEFERLVVEVRLGRDLPDAMRAVHARIGNQDFEWFVQALQIHREVGGDLAEILDTVAGTIRERTRLRRHVSTLSAEGRLSALILFVLPFAVAGLLSVINPEYMAELFGSGIGKALLGMAALFMTAGFFWLRKLIRIEL